MTDHDLVWVVTLSGVLVGVLIGIVRGGRSTRWRARRRPHDCTGSSTQRRKVFASECNRCAAASTTHQ